MDFLQQIIKDKNDYMCFNLLKELLTTNEEFCKLIKEGIEKGKITGFSEEMWEDTYYTDIYMIKIENCTDLNDYFKKGYNIGSCTQTSMNLSIIFQYCNICGGTVPFLKDTYNSPDGRHTWINNNGKIIDTSLMLIIDEDYAIKYLKYPKDFGHPANRINMFDWYREIFLKQKGKKR